MEHPPLLPLSVGIMGVPVGIMEALAVLLVLSGSVWLEAEMLLLFVIVMPPVPELTVTVSVSVAIALTARSPTVQIPVALS
jgi:hypothetical protein